MRITSIKVLVLWWGSCLVGVVIVVVRLFSRRKEYSGFVLLRVSRFMLISPCIVIEVSGDFVRIVSSAVCMSLLKLCFFLGRLYMFNIVWIG